MANYDYNKFVQLCLGSNKTPSAIAGEIGVSKSLISRWKKGGGLSDVTAAKICDHFDLQLFALAKDPDEPASISGVRDSVVLQGNTGNNTVNNGRKSEELTEHEQEVLRIFRSLDMRKKTTVLSYLYEIEDGEQKRNSE